MRNVLRGMLVAALILLPAAAAFSVVYTDYMDPIDAGVGARVPALGAFVAAADDVNSIFYNPAGLAYAKGKQFSLGSTFVINNTMNNSFGMYFAGSDEAFGFGVVTRNEWQPLTAAGSREPASGRIITLEAVPYNFNNTVVVLSYGAKLNKFINIPFMENFAFGVSLKGFAENITASEEVIQATGINFDSGLIYTANSWLRFALVGQNTLLSSAGGHLTWVADSGYTEPFQANYKFGMSTKLLGKGSMMGTDQTLTMNIDAIQNNVHENMPYVYSGGLEWYPVTFLALRLGSEQVALDTAKPKEFNVESNFTGGLGLTAGDWTFDYAYHRYGDDQDNSLQYVSVSYLIPEFSSTQETHVTATATIAAMSTAETMATPEAIATLEAPLPQLPEITSEVLIKINGPEDRSFVDSASVILSVKVLSPRVFYLDVNGVKTDVSGEAGRIVTMPVPLRDIGRQDIIVKCLNANGVLNYSTVVRLYRLPVFSDIPADFWAKDNISYIAALGLISGYPDNTFKPGRAITRAELASILVKASGYTTPEPTFSGFYDVDKSNWASYYIKYGSDLGILTGYPDGNFYPTKPVNRAEGVSVIVRFAHLEEPEEVLVEPYPDVPMEHWAAKAITAARDAGLLAYMGDKPFGLKQYLTRAEVAAMLAQTEYAKDKIKKLFD